MNEYLPGLAGVPATKSNISSIDGEKGILAYRGYDIRDLVQSSNFEETVLLLLDGELPTASELEDFDQQLRGERPVLLCAGTGRLRALCVEVTIDRPTRDEAGRRRPRWGLAPVMGTAGCRYRSSAIEP